jgi:integrase
MVFLDAATGLRRSELLALKWADVDFENLQTKVQRSIYRNVIGHCKTESSKKPVPMDPILAAELWSWKQHSSYSQPCDWVFASPRSKGKNPYWPDMVLSRVVRPAAARAGIQKHVGWHTFRHSFSSMLIANGVVKKTTVARMNHNSERTLVVGPYSLIANPGLPTRREVVSLICGFDCSHQRLAFLRLE